MSKMVEYKIEPKRMQLVYPFVDKRTEYGADRGAARWKIKTCRGKTADRL